MKVTFSLLNWKRPNNLREVIKSIKSQTIDTQIIVWNNGDINERFDCDLQIDSSRNLICDTRWKMISYIDTEYFATLDDDLMFANENVLENMLKEFEVNNDDYILGPFGRIIHDKYSNGIDITNNQYRVDVVKGRMMLMKSKFLRDNLDHNYEPDCEDIKVCSYSKNKECYYKLDDFIELDEGNVALWKQNGWSKKRDKAYGEYFGENK